MFKIRLIFDRILTMTTYRVSMSKSRIIWKTKVSNKLIILLLMNN